MGIFDFVIGNNKRVLYFPGCYSDAFLKEKAENYRRILKKLKIDFSILKEKDFICCGGVLDEAGYEKQLRKISKENFSFFKTKKINKIITSCPLCYNTLRNYKSFIPEWEIETEFIVSAIIEKIEQNEKFIKLIGNEQIAYYDSCYLARYLKITDSPRNLLGLLGYKVIEFPYKEEETLCCGSCGNLTKTNQELADNIASKFIKMLNQKKIKKIVTADPRAYLHLKKNLETSDILKINEIEIIELSDLLCEALEIKKA